MPDEAFLYFVDLCNKIRKILEVHIESVVWIKVPAPKLPAEFANCMQIRACFAIPLGELNINLKMDAAFKNPFAICDPFPRQGLSNHTTFSLIEYSTFKKDLITWVFLITTK
jgi:hypothetical protein